MKSYKTVDEYIANFPRPVQSILTKIRDLTREIFPDAEEAVRYGIPTVRVGGHNIVHYAAYESHIGMYPAQDPLIEQVPELAKYRTGKGTFQFKLSESIPYDLIKKIIEYHAKRA